MTQRSTLVFTLVTTALLSVAGCKGQGEEASASPAAPEPATIDVAAINAAVPEDLSAAITFSQASADDERIVAAVPSSWETGNIPGRYRPARGADLGFFTGFGVGSTCDGTCAPKDWKATADKERFAQFTGGDYEIVADEAIDGGRFVHARKKDTVYLAFAWWKEGASRYFICSATLEGPAAAAAPAFEKACRSMVIIKWE